MRVGRRGYIETPTRVSDIMFNYTHLRDHHRWHVNRIGTTLVFMEWESAERRDTQVNEFFHMAKSKYKNPFQDRFDDTGISSSICCAGKERLPTTSSIRKDACERRTTEK